MISKENNRVSIFIVGSNLYNNLKNYKIKINFEDLIKIIKEDMDLIKVYYYTAVLDKDFDSKRYDEHNKFLNKLKKIPNFIIRLSNLKKNILKDGSIIYSIKGDDVYLATDILCDAFNDEYDTAVIISGDEDFVPVINVIKSMGKKVINAFFPKSSSYKLRNICDRSLNLKIELNKFKSPNITKL